MTAFRVRCASLTLAAAVGLLLIVTASGCDTYVSHHRDRALTQAEHDSILATETDIPGTVVVARALDTKERNARKNAAFNAQMDSLTGVRGR